MSPTANDGIFLGYHIQPGFAWKGEYLVAKLDALDYHAENGSITVQRARRLELVPGGFTFPLRALHEAKEPKPDRIEDEEPRPIPYESEMQPIADVQTEHEIADEEQPEKSPVDDFFLKSNIPQQVRSFQVGFIGTELDL